MASHNNPPRDDPNETVRKMLCVVDDLHKHLYAKKTENRLPRSNDGEGEETYTSKDSIHPPFDEDLFLRLSHHLRLLTHRLIKLQDLHADVQDELWKHVRPLDVILSQVTSSAFSSQFSKGMKWDIAGITRRISDLVAKVPPLPDKPARQKTLYSHDGDGDNNGKGIANLPGLHEIPEVLTKFEVYRQVEQRFKELELERKMCLLSFAVFPENREVHRTMLMYWWIGEGIIPAEGAEETVREILKDFTAKKLVEPVGDRRKVAASSYKMNSFVHSSVIHLSKEIGLFDIYHKGQKPSMNNSNMGKVCLVDGSSKQQEAAAKIMLSRDQIETVFNVSERFPEFTFEWFSENQSGIRLIRLSRIAFKSLRVFHLGRWERTLKRHIQVPNPDIMKCLKFMKNLRVLSFQGISTIRRLKSSVCKLHKLLVLDLRECSDLTELPEKIGSLQNLVYLDITGCYMLEWIPMRLALLNNLEVLKGFVVSETMYEGDACRLNLLKRLKKLRKLSIEIHRDDIGVHQLMEDLVNFKALTSLKVTWRRNIDVVRASKLKDFTEIKTLPHQLKKLDLLRFPHEQLPTWLQPHNLHHLKKLQIGGGKTLKDFGDLPEMATQCAVEVLRLRSLPKLRVGWIELKQLYFPNLIFLEKYECPRVSLTPCDGKGIWRSDQDD